MGRRDPEKLLQKEVRCAAQEWIKHSQSENPHTLMRALLQWLGHHRESREQQMLALALAEMLLMQVSATQHRGLDLSGSEASPDEELVKTWRDICRKHHFLPQQSEQEPGERQVQTLADILMVRVSAIKMRQILSELRRWLRTWLASQGVSCGAHATASPLTPG
jgi:hypothetical protein